jgi:hypothetical protein
VILPIFPDLKLEPHDPETCAPRLWPIRCISDARKLVTLTTLSKNSAILAPTDAVERAGIE